MIFIKWVFLSVTSDDKRHIVSVNTPLLGDHLVRPSVVNCPLDKSALLKIKAHATAQTIAFLPVTLQGRV
jgi:hypothetical protein